MQDTTKVILAGRKPFDNMGIVNPPVYHASTILFETVAELMEKKPSKNARYRYGLHGTPTMLALEEGICALENAEAARLVPSGLAAITLIFMSFARAGGHILIPRSCYEPTRHLAHGILKRMGVITEFYDPIIGADIAGLIQENTCLVFLESPGSLTFEVQDVPAIAKICNEKNIPTALDNCWGNGYHFKPLDHGVDVSMQAATKYISGGSDLLLGTLAYNKHKIGDIIHDTWFQMGAVPSSDIIFDCMRGLRSMAVRLDHHMQAGLEIAQFLKDQPEVKQIVHPAMPCHPQYALWQRDFKGAPSLYSFILHTPDHLSQMQIDNGLAKMIEPMRLFKMGFSWGGYESLITPFDVSLRGKDAWTQEVSIRIHVGLEAVEDLKIDLRTALDRWRDAIK